MHVLSLLMGTEIAYHWVMVLMIGSTSATMYNYVNQNHAIIRSRLTKVIMINLHRDLSSRAIHGVYRVRVT